MKDFAIINFGEFFKSTKETLYSKLGEKMPGEKTMMESISSDNCVYVYNIKILNLFYPELHLINTKTVIKSKLKDSLRELRNSRQF